MSLLSGLRVLDLTNVLAGPFATLHLALGGAEVIKIENPGGGDLARKLGCVPDLNAKLMGTSFLAQNANKKSMTLNLKAPEGREVLKKLAATADVLVENFRPGVMERLGLSYDVLAEINPRLVYCAISGFGQTGPDAFKPAYDQIIQGLSGVMAVNGDERLNPLRCGFPVCDTVGGLNAAFAIMGALYHRERTGEGQFIDVALLDSIMPLMGWVAANLLIGGQPPGADGQRQLHGRALGHVRHGRRLHQHRRQPAGPVGGRVRRARRSGTVTDPRFEKRDTRKANRKLLTPLLEAKLKQRPTSHWVEALNARGVPSGEILSLEDALNAAQVAHRGSLGTLVEPEIGPLQGVRHDREVREDPGQARHAAAHASARTRARCWRTPATPPRRSTRSSRAGSCEAATCSRRPTACGLQLRHSVTLQ